MSDEQKPPDHLDVILPPKPATPILPLMHAERCALFGRFGYKPDPQPDNPEHIIIDNAWVKQNLVPVSMPQLENRAARVHRLIARQFLGMFAAWEAAGLMPLVLTFDGTWASRFKRGYRFGDAHLSNHCWGTAVDLCAHWNPLGQEPAAVGEKGCVRQMVPIAHDFGFAWGGDFSTRKDGMHFEVYRIIE
jgi:hypothetical protein